jgi:omega-6 fatty acid desaturase (delta-12 desaturase)
MSNETPLSLSSTSPNPNPTAGEQQASWKELVAEFQRPCTRRALWQVLNTFVPYCALWVLMYYSVAISWWLTLPLTILAAGFLVRIFIIFHDCGHGSFFKSRKANDLMGLVGSLLFITPYYHWRWEHSVHHANSADLDGRGIGDFWTLTVDEYLAAPAWKRFAYRVVRSPFVLFFVAPIALFIFWQRIPSPKAKSRERNSVYSMNLGIAIMCLVMGSIYGFVNYLILQGLIISFAGAAGVWLFYVQHQFEGVYWARSKDWDHLSAALEGSSFYKLPRVLQWFSGNIGFHHIHHLSPRIPNYYLEKCHNAHPLFQRVKQISLLDSLKCLKFRLWDEKNKQLVGFEALKSAIVAERTHSFAGRR